MEKPTGSDPIGSEVEQYEISGSVKRAASAGSFNAKVQHTEAKNATEREHQLTVRNAIRLYPRAFAFSLLFSTAVIMDGYDLSLLSSFYGYTAFQDKYGDESGAGGKVISASWQTKIQNSGLAGQIIGLFINGWLSETFGYKKTMLVTQVFLIGAIFIPFFAPNIQTICAGNVILGIPWGVFQTLSVTYAADVAPMALRPYLTTYVNLCWVIGQFIFSGVSRGFVDSGSSQWAYRIPFALQWIWPPFIIAGTLFAPESPWWLVRKGRYEDAKKALLYMTSRKTDLPFDADEQVSLIKVTNDMEKSVSAGTNYWHCFMGIDLHRTEIACISYVAQTLCGTALMGYSIQFYERAGLSETNAFNFNIGQSAMGFVGTILSWFLMAKFGRRTIYLTGMSMLFILLITVGGLGFASATLQGPSWAIGTLLVIYTFTYDMTVGPVCYSLVAEIPSTRHKIKTVVLARNLGNILGFMNNTLMPRMLGVNSWNWGAKTGLFWAGFCVLILIWAYFRLPEPKGRTYAELDLLFEHKVSARKFASTHVDQFSGAQVIIQKE